MQNAYKNKEAVSVCKNWAVWLPFILLAVIDTVAAEDLNGGGVVPAASKRAATKAKPPAKMTAPTKPPAAKNSKPSEPSSIAMETVEVTEQREAEEEVRRKRYYVPEATTATKTDTPIMETPAAIQVVPQQVLKDQQVVRLEDTYKNVSGVDAGFGYQNFYDDVYIRGFLANGNIFRTGFRQQYFAFDTADLDRVEVLKGPAAMLYGRIEPGGIINKVAKQPLPEAYYSLQQQFGSYDFYRTSLDATGPVLDDRSLLYRFNLAYVNSDSFRDVNLHRIFVAPTLHWQAGSDTEFNLALNYQHQNSSLDEGIPGMGNRPARISLDTNTCIPGCDLDHDQVALYFDWSHRFTEDWSIRNGFSGGWTHDFIQELGQGPVNPQTNLFSQYPWLYSENSTTYQTYLDLLGKFDLAGTKHSVLVGVNYFDRDYEQGFRGDVALTQNVFALNRQIFDFAPYKALGFNQFYPRQDEWFGVYFQDQITLFDSLHILGGGRYDWANTRTGFSTVSSSAADLTTVHNQHFSPRVGILYRPWSWASLYGNYTESLGAPNSGRSFTRTPFSPEFGEQYEAGLKTEFFENRLSATLAYFHLTKQNTLTADIDHPGYSVAIGEARSQGIEFDLRGQVTDQLTLIGTYAFIDARITQGSAALIGDRLAGVPENQGSLWAKYELIPEKFEFGAGAYVIGRRQSFGNVVQLPGYVRVDAFAAYHHQLGPTRLTTQININNLFDKGYYKTPAFGQGGLPGEPLTVLGSLRLEF